MIAEQAANFTTETGLWAACETWRVTRKKNLGEVVKRQLQPSLPL